MSTAFPPPASLAISDATSTYTAAVGLGYGIAIAVALLVLISTILLASYLCVRSKPSLPVTSSPPPPSSPPLNFVPGLDPHTIDAFYPKFLHHESSSFTSEGNNNAAAAGTSGPCPICLGEYAAGDVLRRGPDCGHCFHAACVDEWLRLSATCPLCRSSPVPSPVATPLSELIPLARTSRGR